MNKPSPPTKVVDQSRRGRSSPRVQLPLPTLEQEDDASVDGLGDESGVRSSALDLDGFAQQWESHETLFDQHEPEGRPPAASLSMDNRNGA